MKKTDQSCEPGLRDGGVGVGGECSVFTYQC